MSHRVSEAIRYFSFNLLAADLGLTVSLVGAGTLVNLMGWVPPGYTARIIRLRRLGTITNGSGTTVCDIGPTSDPDKQVDAINIEGTVGDIDISAETRDHDFGAGEAMTLQVTTATAACSAVAGLRVEFELVKYASEENA